MKQKTKTLKRNETKQIRIGKITFGIVMIFIGVIIMLATFTNNSSASGYASIISLLIPPEQALNKGFL